MRKIYLSLIIGICLIGIVIAGSLLPKSDSTIKINKSLECLTNFTVDGRVYTLHFIPGNNVSISRDSALKSNLEQSYFLDKINTKLIKVMNVSSTICSGNETLGEGKITLEVQK